MQKNLEAMPENLALSFVHSLYQNLLGREPDATGVDSHMNAFKDGNLRAFEQLVETFSSSKEFQQRLSSAASKVTDLEKHGEFNFEDLDHADLIRLNEVTSRYWKSLSLSGGDLYWSVITNDLYRGALSSEIKSRFLESGRGDVARIELLLDRVGRSLSEFTSFLEFGCGVGRTVYGLPEHFSRIKCIDFSSEHLAEAKNNLCHLSSCDFFLASSPFDLCNISDKYDLIHSFIVLQHNTPPVMQKLVEQLLGMLSENGVAILHMPIARGDYAFDYFRYMQDPHSGMSMEMHILPRANIYKAAQRSECRLEFSCAMGGCGGDIYSEMMVFSPL